MIRLLRNDFRSFYTSKIAVLIFLAFAVCLYFLLLGSIFYVGDVDDLTVYAMGIFVVIGSLPVMAICANDFTKHTLQIKLLKGYTINQCLLSRFLLLLMIPYPFILFTFFIQLLRALYLIAYWAIFYSIMRYPTAALAYIPLAFSNNFNFLYFFDLSYALIPFSFYLILSYSVYYFVRNAPIIFITIFIYIVVTVIFYNGVNTMPVLNNAILESFIVLFFGINYFDFVGFMERVLLLSDRLLVPPVLLYFFGLILQILKISLVYVLLKFRINKNDLINAFH